ncbi:hypothetical protein QVD17_25778 [Tagetes erecta]|uniref:Uncharacterized protein n=1 Tax=Tagetes erecta TaxID=13708 RepID=A0AAD8K7N5_TARER|nr:hypothetical protein QVD17_25778 [Tagetes erecta]
MMVLSLASSVALIDPSPSGMQQSSILFQVNRFQIGDLQSYLSDLSLFLAPDCKMFYVLVDNRPWLEDLVSRPTHLWQLMSRLSPFAITRTLKDQQESPNLRRWLQVIDAAILTPCYLSRNLEIHCLQIANCIGHYMDLLCLKWRGKMFVESIT